LKIDGDRESNADKIVAVFPVEKHFGSACQYKGKKVHRQPQQNCSGAEISVGLRQALL
jgi:hypothetical protein